MNMPKRSSTNARCSSCSDRAGAARAPAPAAGRARWAQPASASAPAITSDRATRPFIVGLGAARPPSLSLLRLAVDDPAAAGPDVDAAVHARIAGDDAAEPILVAVVVDPDPARPGVVGAEEAGHLVDLADEIQRRVGLAGRRLAEAERVGLGHARDGLVGLAR